MINKKITITVSEGTHRKLRAASGAGYCSVNNIVQKAIDFYFEKNGVPDFHQMVDVTSLTCEQLMKMTKEMNDTSVMLFKGKHYYWMGKKFKIVNTKII